ncbi:hypothetical protein E2C01_057024 [Portunus trituberculatus]|uniref:Uncharacterized protein n=1 Tax=Portunus trituberculatus TaxID=210409 RepID=A0A5B7GYX9_PORTR|nr:hypothetical protein [Portunus trituberculatus]
MKKTRGIRGPLRLSLTSPSALGSPLVVSLDGSSRASEVSQGRQVRHRAAGSLIYREKREEEEKEEKKESCRMVWDMKERNE